jgi:hypothetical protein
MASPATASSQGPEMFQRASARFKYWPPVPRQERGTAESSETSDSESLYESAVEGTSPSTQSHETEKSFAASNRRVDSLFLGEAQHLLSASTARATVLTPSRHDLQRTESLPECLRIRPNADRIRADQVAAGADSEGESLDSMRRRMNEGFARLDIHQQELDQLLASNQEVAEHIEDDYAYCEAQAACELAIAEERVIAARAKVSYERKKAEAYRLQERIVAEDVPLSAGGRAECDLAEIRRIAAPRAARQMVPDSFYPSFCPRS